MNMDQSAAFFCPVSLSLFFERHCSTTDLLLLTPLHIAPEIFLPRVKLLSAEINAMKVVSVVNINTHLYV